MQFTVAAFFALAGSAIAQYVDPTPGFNPLTKPTTNEVIPAGKPYTIKWTQGGQAGPVSLYAYAGESASTLQEVGTIATGLDASLGTYEWQVEPSLGGKYKAYGIKIALASDKTVYQWSNPFTISGDASSSSSSASASSSVASTSSSSVTAKTGSTTMTSATSSAAPTTSSSVIITTTPRSNLSTTASTEAPTSQVTLVTSTSRGPASPSGSTTAPTTVPTGGAIAKGASSLAVIGGLAMAVLAM